MTKSTTEISSTKEKLYVAMMILGIIAVSLGIFAELSIMNNFLSSKIVALIIIIISLALIGFVSLLIYLKRKKS